MCVCMWCRFVLKSNLHHIDIILFSSSTLSANFPNIISYGTICFGIISISWCWKTSNTYEHSQQHREETCFLLAQLDNKHLWTWPIGNRAYSCSIRGFVHQYFGWTIDEAKFNIQNANAWHRKETTKPYSSIDWRE